MFVVYDLIFVIAFLAYIRNQTGRITVGPAISLRHVHGLPCGSATLQTHAVNRKMIG